MQTIKMLTVVVPMLILLGLCPGSALSGALPVGSGTDPYGELLTRIERLEQRDRQQSEHIAALESNMAAMAVVIKDQQREIDDLKSKAMGKLDVPEQGTGQADTSNAKDSGPDKVSVSESRDQETEVPKSSIRAVRGPEAERQLTRAARDGKVAFFAIRKADLLHLGVNQNIPFESSMTNIGNDYNPHHGVFTAPVSGTYLFSVSILAYNIKEVWAQITLNGNVVSHIYARGTDNRYDQGSQTVILNLKPGDDVTVQNQASDDAINGAGYSSFTGLLLWPTQSEAVIVG